MENKELITKEELLELGFKAYSKYDPSYNWTKTGYILKIEIGFNVSTIDVLTNEKNVMLEVFCCFDGYINDSCYINTKSIPKKQNIIKLIEIAKLIGELE